MISYFTGLIIIQRINMVSQPKTRHHTNARCGALALCGSPQLGLAEGGEGLGPVCPRGCLCGTLFGRQPHRGCRGQARAPQQVRHALRGLGTHRKPVLDTVHLHAHLLCAIQGVGQGVIRPQLLMREGRERRENAGVCMCVCACVGGGGWPMKRSRRSMPRDLDRR